MLGILRGLAITHRDEDADIAFAVGPGERGEPRHLFVFKSPRDRLLFADPFDTFDDETTDESRDRAHRAAEASDDRVRNGSRAESKQAPDRHRPAAESSQCRDVAKCGHAEFYAVIHGDNTWRLNRPSWRLRRPTWRRRSMTC